MRNLAVIVDEENIDERSVDTDSIEQNQVLLRKVIKLESEARLLYEQLVTSSYLFRSRLYERNAGIQESVIQKNSSSPQLTSELQKKVVHYLPLVRMIAIAKIRKMPANIQLDDLISDGVLGLIDGIQKLDESSSDPTLYLKIRISGAISDGLRKLDYHSQLTRQMERYYKRVLHSLQEQGINPTDEIVAERMGITFQQYEAFRELSDRKLCYIEDFKIKANDGNTLDFFPYYQVSIHSTAEADITKNEKLISVAYTVSRLENKVQKEVFVDSAINQLSHFEIGQKLDIEQNRICQIWRKTLCYLQKMVPFYMSNYRLSL